MLPNEPTPACKRLYAMAIVQKPSMLVRLSSVLACFVGRLLWGVSLHPHERTICEYRYRSTTASPKGYPEPVSGVPTT